MDCYFNLPRMKNSCHKNSIHRSISRFALPSFIKQVGARFIQTFKYGMDSSTNDPSSSIQRQIQKLLLSYRVPLCHHRFLSCKAFLTAHLTVPRNTRHWYSRVASQQDKVKPQHDKHDKHAKSRVIAPSDSVLARDHLSGWKWQSGTVVKQTCIPLKFS